MLAKLTTICYIHNCTERLTQEFTVKKVTGIVSATSIKVLDLDYEDMPALEEKVGDREPSNFWAEAKHDANNKYLSNKTSTIPEYQQGRKPHGATPKVAKKNRPTLSNMNPTSLSSALKTNPVPNMSDQQFSSQSNKDRTTK
ncbi:20840_t:CDS:2 [Dentiscutata erythropus]|uniref:20840_t:CDS:1 n=1 Tax=Dentiscutata erythropus TaxID=1348616 RepID=A0A9N9ECS9_9GLOM|nr:20840_t:CDS:2 [Dentiscutata erythropus]